MRRTFAFLLALTSAAVARDTVNLGYGVRFAPSASSSSCDASFFPLSLNNVQCQNLRHVTAATSASTCQAAACSSLVQGWQWLQSQGCWVGATNNCTTTTDAWVGGGRNGTGPGPSPPQAQMGFDDSTWEVVDAPHDATILNNFTQSANGGEAFLPPAVTWYRKHFRVSSTWQGSVITLMVDSALSTSDWYLNGKQLVASRPNGYLPLVLRLDTNGLLFGDSSVNVLTAYIDGSETTGWWYEGSGLGRMRLISTPSAGSIVPFGISSPAYVSGAYHPNGGGTPAEGLYAESVVFTPTATLSSGAGNTQGVYVAFTLLASDGTTVVATETSKKVNLSTSPLTVASVGMTVANCQLWTVPRPYLHTLVTTLFNSDGSVLDTLNTSVGIRDLSWDPERGLFVNEQPVKMRGACNHESFAGTGGVVPARVDLMRVQQMRGVGMNAWRTSHNPPEPALLDITDRLGILVMDENRVLATQTNCVGCPNVPTYAGDVVADMGSLALRDRNHPSVAFWSECNEAGCGDGSLLANLEVERGKEAFYTNDGSRMVSGNMGWLSPTKPRTPMSTSLDVMGFSHNSYEEIYTFHKAEPEKPLVMSECCSCEGQRGENSDMPHNSSDVFYSDLNAGCLAEQTQVSNAVPWMAGTFVWTLHDYVGEPDHWPHISSSFGAYDLAGFPKAAVSFYRAWWLSNISSSDPSRPPLDTTTTTTTVHIVESWQAPPPGPANNKRVIHVYSNAPGVVLIAPGVPASPFTPISPFGFATFNGVNFVPGSTLTAQAMAEDGTTVLATHSVKSWGAPAALVLTLDAPSIITGTGGAVYLDGEDVALLRATVIDASGVRCDDAALPITFTVTSGPGLVWGSGSGNPSDHDPFHAPTRTTYHGLARAIVRAALVGAGSDVDRAALAYVNVEAGKGPTTASILSGSGTPPPTSMTITASSPGLTPATFVVPLSVDPLDSVLEVAERSVGVADLSS